MWSRRDLVQDSIAALLMTALPSLKPLQAQDKLRDAVEPHFFIFVQIYGAWDVCLAFDPKDRNAELSSGVRGFDQPYAFDQVRRVGPHLLAPDGMPLAPYADRMAIINGIDMEIDGGHMPQIVMSGDPNVNQSAKPFIQAILSEKHPYLRSLLIPHLYASYDGFFLGGPYGAKTITISGSDAYAVLFDNQSGGDLRKVGASTKAFAAGYSGTDRLSLNQYLKAIDQAVLLRERLKTSNQDVAIPSDGASFGNFAGTLFRTGILGSLTWSLGGGDPFFFDTHTNHYAKHPFGLMTKELAALCQQLESLPFDEQTSVFDHTTVVVNAEFCRTPKLNVFQGKDHNFRTNSMLLIGKNVKAGSYGKSGERIIPSMPLEAHAGLPIDFATGQASVDGKLLNMRNIWAGAGDVFGVNLREDFGTGTSPVRFLDRG